MDTRNIIVIGASTGGFEVLQKIIAKLPPDFAASIFIVWHMSADVKGILPHVLNKLNTIKASNAVDGETIQPNHIYVAPPDFHMLIEDGLIRVTRGPKENLFRPAVDPLFRSAAQAYGKRVIGIILSGGLDDGTSGLWQIKAAGGIAIVQNPEDAVNPSMPESALRGVKVDYCLSVDDLPAQLVKLSNEKVVTDREKHVNDRARVEIDIAAEGNALEDRSPILGNLSPYSCPECHGVLSKIMEDSIIRFRCHTGHAYSASTLLLAICQKTEDSLYEVIRGMDETIFLLNHMGDHYSDANVPKLAAAYFKAANSTMQQSKVVRNLVHDQRQLTPDELAKEAAEQQD